MQVNLWRDLHTMMKVLRIAFILQTSTNTNWKGLNRLILTPSRKGTEARRKCGSCGSVCAGHNETRGKLNMQNWQGVLSFKLFGGTFLFFLAFGFQSVSWLCRQAQKNKELGCEARGRFWGDRCSRHCYQAPVAPCLCQVSVSLVGFNSKSHFNNLASLQRQQCILLRIWETVQYTFDQF